MILLLGSAQCAFCPMLDFCPAAPDPMLGMLLAILLLIDEKSAAVCAIAAGFFVDAVGGAGVSLSPIVYFAFVAIMTAFSKKVLKSFASYLLLLVPTLIYRAAATYICAAIAFRELPGLWIVSDILLPEMIVTGILCLPVYFVQKIAAGILGTHNRFTF
jgi:hypothetical protein